MPFPLAHPAAVLPFRRLCPHRLSFCALLIGSIVPDTSYSLDDLVSFPQTLVFLLGPWARNLEAVKGDWEWSDFSHTLAGSVLFCIPAGLLMLWVFLGLRATLVAALPNPYRDALLPLCAKRNTPLSVFFISLLIGIWIHLAWDTFTHDNGWLVVHWDFLRSHIWFLGFHPPVSQVVWLISSSGGMLALLLAWRGFLKTKHLSVVSLERSEWRHYWFWLAVLLLPIAAAWPTTRYFVHKESLEGNRSALFHIFAEYYLITLVLGLMLIGLITKKSGPRAKTGAQSHHE